ncbi:MAG: hypothetical protein AB7G37_06370 [Solirubrobacteraceae bacterium]
MNVLADFYCHDCDSWQVADRAEPPNEDLYECAACGSIIQCDECGANWTDAHQCEQAR